MAQRVTKTEMVENDFETASKETVAKYSVVDQFLYLIFGIVEFLLMIRFVFRLTGASTAAGIVRLIYSATDILMAPYRFIFPTNQVEGVVFEWSVLVAMIFYALFMWIIMHLLGIVFTADTANE